MGLLPIFSILNQQGSSFSAVATDFAASAYIQKSDDFTGNANGKQGIVSFWINPVSINNKFIFAHTLGFFFYIATNGNILQVFGANASSSGILDVRSTSGINNAVWTHVLASWDLATGTAKLFINGVDDTDLHTATNDTIKYTPATGWQMGGRSGNINACYSEFYFAPNQFIDLTNPVNVSKFISGGKPVSLGNNGSLPTGVAPLMYMRQNGASVLVNSGSGGDFDTINGTVGNCASSPSN